MEKIVYENDMQNGIMSMVIYAIIILSLTLGILIFHLITILWQHFDRISTGYIT